MSSIVQQDRAFLDTLLLKALEKSQDNALKHTTLKSMIQPKGSEPLDDDRIWNLFIINSQEQPDTLEDCVSLLDRILHGYPQHRNALLATIELSTQSNQHQPVDLTKVVDNCMTYYQMYGNKAFCFDDIMKSIKKSNPTIVDTFAERAISIDVEGQPVKQLFLLKLQVHLALRNGLDQHLLTECVVASLNLYEPKSVVSGEAAYIAALSLIYLCHATGNKDMLQQANVHLHTASLRYKDYYPLRVLLLLVQRLSGQIHMSMDTFWHLNIKNIQWETAGYLLLERISTLHPFQHGKGDNALNPLGGTDAALTVFSNSERSLDKAIRDGLKYGSYSNVTDTVNLRRRLQCSLARQLYTIEERKMQRLLGHQIVPKFEIHDDARIDLRDTAFLPTYGLVDGKWKDMLLGFARPGDHWIEAMNLHETLMSYFSTQLNTTPAGVINFTLDSLLKTLRSSCLSASGLSQPEIQAHSIYTILAEIVLHQEKKYDKEVKLEALMESLKSLEEEHEPPSVNGVRYPDAEWLHHHFNWLEVLQTVAMYATVVNAKIKTTGKANKFKPSEGLQQLYTRLRTLIPTHHELIRKSARKVREGLGQAGVLGKLVDAALGRSSNDDDPEHPINSRLVGLIDETVAEEYCGSCRDSWEDALDGLLSVKIKGA